MQPPPDLLYGIHKKYVNRKWILEKSLVKVLTNLCVTFLILINILCQTQKHGKQTQKKTIRWSYHQHKETFAKILFL